MSVITAAPMAVRMPVQVTPDAATWTGILTAIGAAVITLIAAILGGAAGMRYHRRVDRAGFGDDRV